MTAMDEDSATGDGVGGVTERIKHYCTQALANLKAGRLKEAYLFANEALELDKKDAKAAALYRHVLYTLHPKKRLLDKAKSLHEEADRFMKAGNHHKALELLSLAKKWHCTPGVLYARANVNFLRRSFDLAYLNVTEGLVNCKEEKINLAPIQRASLSHLGYKVLPAIESDPYPNEMPARYHINNWLTGLRVNQLHVFLVEGYAAAMETNGTVLKPLIPLNQLAQFLNNHVQGAVQNLSFSGGNGVEGVVLRLLDEVIVPGRLHADFITFTDFFHLSWASIMSILDGRTLRANIVGFLRLQLPSGVDANELLKLPTVRKCTHLSLELYTPFVPQPPGLPPLFNNAALLEWIKRSGGRSLHLTIDYLSSGLLSFINALKKDFRLATQVHSYDVVIRCPHTDVAAGLGVQDEELCNRLGEEMVIDVDAGLREEDEELSNRLSEKMRIGVGKDLAATDMMKHRFETVFVMRIPPELTR